MQSSPLALAFALLLMGTSAIARTADPAPPPAASATPGTHAVAPAIAGRAGEVVAIINGGGNVAVTFAASFRAAVADDKLKEVFSQLTEGLGKAESVTVARPLDGSTFAAAIIVRFEHGTAEMNLVVAPVAPHQVTGLLVTSAAPSEQARLNSFDDICKALAALPGKANFAAIDLAHSDTPLGALNPDTPLALGSAFKLFVLAELVREIEAGERSWDDTLVYDGEQLPSGGFAQTPPGTRLGLRALAEKMVSVSDNSATDLLVRALGPTKIAAMQRTLGIADPAANEPFLTTLQMFKLKGIDGGALGRRYLTLDRAGKAKLLAEQVDPAPVSAIGEPFKANKPIMIDKIEWFATPRDLARVMAWLDAQGSTAAGKEALRILAINPGPGRALAGPFAYVGYKGGSEPGVLNMTLLLKGKAGRRFVVTVGWNDTTDNAVSALQMAMYVERAGQLLAGS